MGNTQILHLALGAILVVTAIWVGISIYNSMVREDLNQMMVIDINEISSHAHQYYIRPRVLGGGQGSYIGYTLPRLMASRPHAEYLVDVVDKDSVIIVGLANIEPYLYIGSVVNNEGDIVDWASGTLLEDSSDKKKFKFDVPAHAKGGGPPAHVQAANQARIRGLAKQAQE